MPLKVVVAADLFFRGVPLVHQTWQPSKCSTAPEQPIIRFVLGQLYQWKSSILRKHLRQVKLLQNIIDSRSSSEMVK